jgi:hypothetical protein
MNMEIVRDMVDRNNFVIKDGNIGIPVTTVFKDGKWIEPKKEIAFYTEPFADYDRYENKNVYNNHDTIENTDTPIDFSAPQNDDNEKKVIYNMYNKSYENYEEFCQDFDNMGHNLEHKIIVPEREIPVDMASLIVPHIEDTPFARQERALYSAPRNDCNDNDNRFRYANGMIIAPNQNVVLGTLHGGIVGVELTDTSPPSPPPQRHIDSILENIQQVNLTTGDILENSTLHLSKLDKEVLLLPKSYMHDLAKENRPLTPKEFQMCVLTTNNPDKLKLLDIFISKLKVLPNEYSSSEWNVLLLSSILIPKNEFGIGVHRTHTYTPLTWNVLSNSDKETFAFEVYDTVNMSANDVIRDFEIDVKNLNPKNAKIKLIALETYYYKKLHSETPLKYDEKTESFKCDAMDGEYLWLISPMNGHMKFKLQIEIPVTAKILKNIVIAYKYTTYIISDHECREALISLSNKIEYRCGDKVGEFIFKNQGGKSKSYPVILD